METKALLNKLEQEEVYLDKELLSMDTWHNKVDGLLYSSHLYGAVFDEI